MKRLIQVLIILFIPIVLFGQQGVPAEIEVIFLKAYTSNNPTLWEQGIIKLADYAEGNPSRRINTELVKAEYGHAVTLLANKRNKECSKVLSAAEKQVMGLIEDDKDNAELKAIYAGLVSLQIAISPMKGMWLGPRSSKIVSVALAIDADDPMALFQNASSYYHTPGMFGGDKAKAVEGFKRTVAIYEANLDKYRNDWMYLSAVTWLGIANKSNGDHEKAKEVFEKCLDLSPDYGWVKNLLLPSVSE